MTLATRDLSFTASEITTFDDCGARFYHGKQNYRTGLLPVDRTAAGVGTAIHDTLMALHRWMEREYQQARPQRPEAIWSHLQQELVRQLWNQRLRHSSPDVAARLQLAEVGLRQAAALIGSDMPKWALDTKRRQSLIWVEAALDHGPAIRGVQLDDGFVVRTRPDLIGLRPSKVGCLRFLIRDYKARGEIVDPAFDTGILIRALWVLSEVQDPRCRWFLLGRNLEIDADAIDLETINLLHGDSAEFSLKATLTEQELGEQRDRLMGTMRDMATVLNVQCLDEVPAAPSAFCLNWCPFLRFCPPGREHTEKYSGTEALAERLAIG